MEILTLIPLWLTVYYLMDIKSEIKKLKKDK